MTGCRRAGNTALRCTTLGRPCQSFDSLAVVNDVLQEASHPRREDKLGRLRLDVAEVLAGDGRGSVRRLCLVTDRIFTFGIS